MSNQHKETGQARPSRRQVLLGRFWAQAALDEPGGSEQPVGHAPVPLAPVMRYPKSLEDVAAADSPNTPTASKPAAHRRTIPLFRPPGAVDELTFLRDCTRCEECIQACPHGAIVQAGAQFREAAGTPTIQADVQPCLMCADFPCIDACEPAVLRRDVQVAMGTAFIKEQLCIAFHGEPCTACYDECPVDGAMELDAGRPQVVEDVCTGCGVCRHICPAPANAVVLMPVFLRSPAPGGHAE